MNIKERLNTDNRKTSRTVKNKSDKFVNEIFLSNKEADAIIMDLMNSSANILFISSLNCENLIISSYLKNYVQKKKSLIIIDDISKKVELSENKKIIIQDFCIMSLVKMLEFSLLGCTGVVTGIDLKSYDNVIEKIQSLILINYPNLTIKQVDNLIYLSNLTLINIEKDNDGLFVIKSIDEIVKTNDRLLLKNKYPNPIIVESKEKQEENNKEIISQSAEQITAPSVNSDFLQTETISSADINVSPDKVLTKEEPVINSTTANEIKKEEIQFLSSKNKYKLLKEKIKNKKRI